MSDPKNELGANFERIKFEVDLAKHIATLNTASILIVSTFLEKISSQPSGKALIAIAISSFLISLLSVLIYQFVLTLEFNGWVSGRIVQRNSEFFRVVKFEGATLAIGLTTFLAGLVAIGIFAVINLI